MSSRGIGGWGVDRGIRVSRVNKRSSGGERFNMKKRRVF